LTRGCDGRYASKRGFISTRIGAKKLGYNLRVVPPGKVQCPFHSHHGEEEMFLMLAGEGELRFGDQRYPIRRHDVIACPTGEYPDSGKVMIGTGQSNDAGLRKMFRAENSVEYYDREPE
jgi:uncharacterized cupin superfamily protein